MVPVIERLDRKTMSAETQREHDKLLNYLRNNVGRMDYPTYLKKGWQIGSGTIDSACKTVVNQRLRLGAWPGRNRLRRRRPFAGTLPQSPNQWTPSGRWPQRKLPDYIVPAPRSLAGRAVPESDIVAEDARR